MIAHVRGIIAEKFGNAVIVDVQGVGYEVQLAEPDYAKMNLSEEVTVFTYHHIREQSQDLFGFSSLAAKKVFELLISVQGVGPKAALAILSLGESEAVRNAIANEDAVFIAKASGVGRKTADRVIVDLSDKVGAPLLYNTTANDVVQELSHTDEALEALIALGYTLNDGLAALEGVSTDLSTADRVREALKG